MIYPVAMSGFPQKGEYRPQEVEYCPWEGFFFFFFKKRDVWNEKLYKGGGHFPKFVRLILTIKIWYL